MQSVRYIRLNLHRQGSYKKGGIMDLLSGQCGRYTDNTGLDNQGNCDDDTGHLERDCNVTLLEFLKFFNTLGELVEDV